MSVLVTGASGLVGSHVVEALAARGEPVRALVRPASRAAVLRLGAEAVTGDVTDPAAWQAAARGGRAIVHSAPIVRSGEHTSELPSPPHIPCPPLLSKKKTINVSVLTPRI